MTATGGEEINPTVSDLILVNSANSVVIYAYHLARLLEQDPEIHVNNNTAVCDERKPIQLDQQGRETNRAPKKDDKRHGRARCHYVSYSIIHR